MYREAVCLVTTRFKIVFALSRTCLYPWTGEKWQLREPMCKMPQPGTGSSSTSGTPAILGPEKCTFFNNDYKSKNKNEILQEERKKERERETERKKEEKRKKERIKNK